MPMKFRAHDTFFIRKGWLSKGMRCVANKPDVFIAHDENPMDVLGIGANMVKAMRYWLQAVGLTKESDKENGFRALPNLESLFIRTMHTLKSWVLCIFCSISLLLNRTLLQRGIFSSTNFLCWSSHEKILLLHYKICQNT